MEEGIKIDVGLMKKDNFKYNEEENSLEKTDNNGCFFTIPIKKFSKKNCETNENKFSIKILKTSHCYIRIGLATLEFNFKDFNHWIGDDFYGWGFNCRNGTKMFNLTTEDFINNFEGKIGYVVSLKFNSIKGEIEIYINDESKGVLFNKIDVKQDYRFVISLSDIGDKVQILQ